MSSALKDARWQLALGYAEEDGRSWDDLDFHWKERYLGAAQARLGLAPEAVIDALAAKFRSHD